MQLNNPKNNTSNLIKQSELAKKKARRKLIGSIFMLFTALIILLNVTTRVKPIPVNPKIIEIRNEVSAPIKASAPAKMLATASISVSADDNAKLNASGEAVATTIDSDASHSNGFRARVINRDEQQATTTNQPRLSNASGSATTPRIITQTRQNKPTPEDILNGNMEDKIVTIYFIQIAASQNKTSLQLIQNNLANRGIKSFIQSTKDNMYRLRVGPFKNKTDANEQLTQITNKI